MATTYASDVSMQELDFSQILRQNSDTIGLLAGIFEEGEVYPRLVSVDQLGYYGAAVPGNHRSALDAAVSRGSHYVVRVVGDDFRRAGWLIGLFQNNGGPLYLDIAPLSASTNLDISPRYRVGGVMVNPNQYSVDDAITEGGAEFFVSSTSNPSSPATTSSLVRPLALVYTPPGDYGNQFKLEILSDNCKKLPAATAAVKIAGGNLVAGTYTYTRVAVTARGERPESTSDEISVTLTSVDIAAGTRAIRVDWNLDDRSAKSVIIYRTFTPAGSSIVDPSRSGRVAELQRGVNRALDDTLRVSSAEATQPQNTDPEDSFQLRLWRNDLLVENTMFSLYGTDQPNKAPPLAQAINNTMLNVGAISLDSNDVIQGVGGTPIVYSVPPVAAAGGHTGTRASVADLQAAIQPFTNRDRYRINLICDLGWSSPEAEAVFGQIAAIQRCHVLNNVPSNQQTPAAAAAYRGGLVSTRRSSLFTPDMRRRNPVTGQTTIVPPAAFAMQAILFSDAVATPGRSPAGRKRGLVDALGVDRPDLYEYDDLGRDLLAKSGVSYFRRRDIGICLWEQLTLNKILSAASYMNVSRIWDIIQNSIGDFLENELQEPNDEYTNKTIVSGLSEYLSAHVLARNISRFEIISDERAGNTNASRDQGIRNIDVYLEPAIPVRRYRCRTILTRQGANFEELVQELQGV